MVALGCEHDALILIGVYSQINAAPSYFRQLY